MACPQYKIVLLGDVAGKSSLVLRFTHDKFQDNGCYPTIGLDFVKKKVTVKDQTLVLQFWELGAATCEARRQETKSCTLSFINDADMLLVVFDVTKMDSLAFAKRWVDIIQSTLGPSKALLALVANKVDLPAAVSMEEVQQFSKDRNVMFGQASAKTGENVSALFAEISEQLQPRVPRSRDLNSDVEELQVATLPRPRRCCFFPNLL